MVLQKASEVVLVVWLDSTMQNGWSDAREIEEFSEVPPLEIQSVGWLLVEQDDWIVLAKSVSENNVEGLLKIPRSVIKSIDYILRESN